MRLNAGVFFAWASLLAQPVWNDLASIPAPAEVAALQPGGKRLAGVDKSGNLCLYNTRDGQVVKCTSVPSRPVRIAWQPDGRALGVLTEGNTLLMAGEDLTWAGKPATVPGDVIAFGTGGGVLATVAKDGTVTAWRLPAMEPIRKWDVSVRGSTGSVEISPPPGLVPGPPGSGLLRPTAATRFFGPGPTTTLAPLSVAVAPDGERIATGEYFRLARLWHVSTQCVQQRFPGRSTGIHNSSFSADGRWLAATSASSVQIYDSTSGALTGRLVPPAGSLVDAVFSERGGIVIRTQLKSGAHRVFESSRTVIPPAARAKRTRLHVFAAGIAEYPDSAWRLKFAETDADALTASLSQTGGTAVRTLKVCGTCATKEELASALESFSKAAGETDTLLVFLSGHGKTLPSGFFFLPYDVDASGLTTGATGTALSSDETVRILNKSAARKQVLILDACEAGGIVTAGRVQPLSGRSLHVFAASQATQRALEIDELGHSLVVDALLQRLRENSGADRRESAASLLEWAKQRVKDLSARYAPGEPQVPRYWRSGADFELVGTQ